MSFIANIDYNITYWFNSIDFPIFLNYIMIFFSYIGNYGLIWIALSLIFCYKKKLKTGIGMLISLFLSLIFVNTILKPLIARARPFETLENINLLISAPTDYSFPSGHTTTAFICFFAVLFTCKNKTIKYLTFILALLVSFSRIYLKVHYLSDVLAGIVLAFILSLVSLYLINKTTLINK